MYEDLFIDPGHGGIDSGAVGPTGLKEKDINLKLALKVGKFLSLQGLSINYTRTTDTQLVSGNKAKDLETRAKLANNAKAKYFLSIHINSAENSAATGTETYAYKQGGEGEKLAKAVNDSLTGAIKLPNRGVKFANFSVLRDTAMPAALTEVCFISNPKEEALLKDEAFLDKAAEAIALGVMGFMGKSYQEPKKEEPAGTAIIAGMRAAPAQGKEWAKNKGATNLFISLVDIYWKLAPAAGVDPVVAFCQSAKETGYGKFGGTLDESYYNPCGMKTRDGGGDADINAHQKFSSWEEGIQAHIDHLALYAGASGYPKVNTPDPRHFTFLKGIAATVEELSGKWAPSTAYGIEIVKMMMELMAVSEPNSELNPEHWAEKHFNSLIEKGMIIHEKRFDDPITRAEIFALLDQIIK